MADLIPFATRHIGAGDVLTVNAEDLYAYLGIQSEFANWVKRAISRAHLIENSDYVIFVKSYENSRGGRGRPAHEYHLSFDAAKHIAMMARSPKGQEVRAWFIQKEKELEQVQKNPDTLLDAYPELRAITDLVVSTAQARAAADRAQLAAEEAKAEAVQATANAHRAIEMQLFFTVAEYVWKEKLHTKIPESAYKALSDHLRIYCFDHNIPFRKIAVGGKRWEDEYGFPHSVYADALPGWLTRRFAQQPLSMIRRPHTDDAS